MNMQNVIGAIAPGLEADIIGVDGNPLQDINAVRRVVFVMKGGQVVENLARGARSAGARTALPALIAPTALAARTGGQ
jgi:cytosine/adenosine deaminase-related metal-dependent hydrolase